jgi:predicted SnoaL-like aldol condensation-catalyzing enzyme
MALYNFISQLKSKAAGLVGLHLPAYKSNPKAEQAATEAALQWLDLIDDERYDEGWELASEKLFKSAVSKEESSRKIRGSREPLGAVVHRKVRSAKYATAMPGAPDGEYTIVKFSTRFENKKKAVETVSLEKSEHWKICGYFVK